MVDTINTKKTGNLCRRYVIIGSTAYNLGKPDCAIKIDGRKWKLSTLDIKGYNQLIVYAFLSLS